MDAESPATLAISNHLWLRHQPLRKVSSAIALNISSFFDHQGFGTVGRLLKSLKGSKPKFDGQPTREKFDREANACGLRVRELLATGPVRGAQKYFVLEKIRGS